jgi:16S rRNA (cytosine1402-N4)-methyltransferase
MSTLPARHVPVLLNEVLDALSPRDGAVYVDGTFGLGGYTRALLEAAQCKVCGIDRDPQAIAAGAVLAAQHPGRLELINGRFGDMERLLTARGVTHVDGVALDIGVSSPQIDEPARGFSFRHDGPLDMRMGTDGPTAADVVNTADEATLADIIERFGEERFARRIARAIVAARAQQPITRTMQLADIVRAVVRRTADGIDPATRTFQALRIYVNDEIGELQRGLAAAEKLLAPGGRLAVVSFHSLEDREVKSFLKRRSGGEAGVSRHLPTHGRQRAPSFTLLTRRAVRPAEAEIESNPRARSARLRAAERTAAPAWMEAA